MNTYPLLQSQLGIFLQCIQNPQSTQYNLPNAGFIPSTVDVERLIDAWRRLIDARPEFRTRFMIDDNGDPQLTELVTNNPEGKAFGLALILYTSSTPCSIDIKERNNGGYNEAQVKALTVWHRDNEADPIMAPGSVWEMDAQTEYSNIATDLNSFVTTNVLQFITGARPMSEWDAFVEEATTSFDVDRLKELADEAVANYLSK